MRVQKSVTKRSVVRTISMIFSTELGTSSGELRRFSTAMTTLFFSTKAIWKDVHMDMLVGAFSHMHENGSLCGVLSVHTLHWSGCRLL